MHFYSLVTDLSPSELDLKIKAGFLNEVAFELELEGLLKEHVSD